MILIAPATAPLFGGILSHYTSWRVAQMSLAIAALVAAVFVALFLPETAHPSSGNGEQKKELFIPIGRHRFPLINPFRPLKVMLDPRIFLAVCLPVIQLTVTLLTSVKNIFTTSLLIIETSMIIPMPYLMASPLLTRYFHGN
jgi:MFS family permease